MRMKQSLTCGLIGLALVLAPGAAQAADLIRVPTSGTMEVPVHEEHSFDWSGFYAGVFGGVRSGSVSGSQAGVGLQAGVNAQFDFMLVGAEVAVRGLSAAESDLGSTSHGQILARAGLVLDDNVLVYAASGYGIDLGVPDESEILVGGGLEFAVTEQISLEAEYLHGFPLEGGNESNQITFGANFHF
jgi:outer membrane immunogenic protein